MTTLPAPALEAAQRLLLNPEKRWASIRENDIQTVARALLASSKEVERMRSALDTIEWAIPLLPECQPAIQACRDARASLPRGKGE